MSNIRAINKYRRALGLGPLPMHVSALVAGGRGEWKEWLHPRDKFGRWIEKLSLVKIGDALSGIIESMNRDGTVTVRIRKGDDKTPEGSRVLVDPSEIENVPVKAFLAGRQDEVVDPGKRPWSPRRPAVTGDLGLPDNATWEQLREALKDRDIIVFDTETTGLDVGPGGKDGPLEIAAVRIRNGEVVDEYHAYVRHTGSVPEFITKLTGIDDSKVLRAHDPARARDDFLRWAKLDDNSVLVAHNIGYDLSVLEGAGRWQGTASDGRVVSSTSKLGIPDDVPTIDTVAISRALMPKGEGPVENHKLGTMAEYFGIDLRDAHTATADTKATGDLLGKLIDYGVDNNSSTDALRDLAQQNQKYNEELSKYAEELAEWRKQTEQWRAWGRPAQDVENFD